MSTEQSVETHQVNVNSDSSDLLPGYTSLEAFIKDGYKTLMESINNSNGLPDERDWNFYKAHKSFSEIIDREGSNIQKLMNSILRSNNIECNAQNRIMVDKTEFIVEANDVILERVANNIDEMNGIRKSSIEPVLIQTVCAELPQISGSWNRLSNATFSVSSSMNPSASPQESIRLLTGKNIVRPQTFFKDKINNSSSYPWGPRISDKPNSLKPLAIFLEETENGEEYSHPYEFELERFSPLPEQLQLELPVEPKSVQETPLIEVTTAEQLHELVEILRNCKHFAVDLEHHSYRSFMGITCLMQISTQETDYIIDTLALREKLCILNEVFTKQTIVKIFHGADMDIQWMQRDLSLYVVNMFDTFQAAKQLEYSGLSLAFLLKKFCNFFPNKQFQLADWRIRPLPDELKAYAREDTHYLIYIYQILKKELLEKANMQDNLLLSVIKRSTEVCMKRYFKPVLRDDSYLDFYRKSKRLFDNRQLYALEELYKWRDHISRIEDESTGYVLPNHMLLQISENLPREMQGILACCNPTPPLLRANLLEIHKIILKAREQSLEKAIMKEDTRARGITKKISKINIDGPLNCPHDLTKINEFRDDLPVLLINCNTNLNHSTTDQVLNIEKTKSLVSVFDTPEVSDEDEGYKTLQTFKFLGPFERYQMVKPYIQAEEEKLATTTNEKSNNVELTSILDNRTDEERIESIREHFLSLTRKTEETADEEPLHNQSLVGMGGTKKRKREVSTGSDTYHPDYKLTDNELHTTVPNIQNQRRKRKSKFMGNDGTYVDSNAVETQFGGQQSKKKKMTQKMRQKFNNKRQQKNNQQVFGQSQSNQAHQKTPNNSQQVMRNNQCGEQSQQRPYNNQKRNNKKNKQHKQFDQPQQNDEFQIGPGGYYDYSYPENQSLLNENAFMSYDYSSVDFRQFEGGAGRGRPQEFQSNYKSKGKKKYGNKGYNKSLTFGSTNRGRKR